MQKKKFNLFHIWKKKTLEDWKTSHLAKITYFHRKKTNKLKNKYWLHLRASFWWHFWWYNHNSFSNICHLSHSRCIGIYQGNNICEILFSANEFCKMFIFIEMSTRDREKWKPRAMHLDNFSDISIVSFKATRTKNWLWSESKSNKMMLCGAVWKILMVLRQEGRSFW